MVWKQLREKLGELRSWLRQTKYIEKWKTEWDRLSTQVTTLHCALVLLFLCLVLGLTLQFLCNVVGIGYGILGGARTLQQYKQQQTWKRRSLSSPATSPSSPPPPPSVRIEHIVFWLQYLVVFVTWYMMESVFIRLFESPFGFYYYVAKGVIILRALYDRSLLKALYKNFFLPAIPALILSSTSSSSSSSIQVTNSPSDSSPDVSLGGGRSSSSLAPSSRRSMEDMDDVIVAASSVSLSSRDRRVRRQGGGGRGGGHRREEDDSSRGGVVLPSPSPPPSPPRSPTLLPTPIPLPEYTTRDNNHFPPPPRVRTRH